jgi:uroporphyrinogen decarboxylase
MDSWAGYLGPDEYRDHVLPHTRRLVAMVKAAHPGIPVIHYANGAPHLLPHFATLGADVVGLDWRVNLADAIKAYPKQVFQGNLDPCALYAPAEVIREKVKALKAQVAGRPHIFNLGHGILPDIDPDHARAFVQAVHEA